MLPVGDAARFGVSYRPVVDADLLFLRDLYASTRSDELAQTGWPDALKDQFIGQQFHAQNVAYASAYPAMHSLIVERAGDAIGRLLLENEGNSLMVVDISLIPAIRGSGIGGAILSDVLQHASREGKNVELSVLSMNPAFRLYQRLGFSITDRTDPYLRMIWHPPT